tara:strand:- start:238 stop:663 length:426 start_codon:yes stop_codon:yes gene_type:complete
MSEKKKKSKLDKAAEIAEKLPMAGAGAIGGLGGYAGYELSKLNKFRKQQDALRRAAHMQRFEQLRNKRLGAGDAGVGPEGQNIVQGGGGNMTSIFGRSIGNKLPPKKNMKKGGKVKSKKPKGCGIARQGVRKAKMITMKGS